MRYGPHSMSAGAAGRLGAAFVSSTLFFVAGAQAFTLGHSRLMSSPGSPLLLTVAVHNLTSAELDSLSVQVPAAPAWAQASLTPPVPLDSLQVRIINGYAPATRIIQVTSTRPFEGRVADLLLDVRTTAGQQRHQVSLLSQAGPSVQPASVAGSLVAVRTGSGVEPLSSGDSIRVRRGDTLLSIVRRNAVPGVSDYQFLVALYRANPKAFSHRNMNLLRAGSELQIPEMADLTAISDREARRIFRQHARAFAAYRQGSAASPGVSAAASIAPAPQPGTKDVTVDQTAGVASANDDTPAGGQQPETRAEVAQQDRLRLSGTGNGGAASSATVPDRSTDVVAATVPGAGTPTTAGADAAGVSDQRVALDRSMSDVQGRVQELQSNVQALQQLNEQARTRAADPGDTTASTADSSIVPGQASGGSGPGANGASAAGSQSLDIQVATSVTAANPEARSSSLQPSSVQEPASPSSVATSVEKKADQTASWLKDNMLAAGVALASLLVLIIAWLLRRRQAGRAARQEVAQDAITEAMIREKLEQVDLNLESPPNDRR